MIIVPLYKDIVCDLLLLINCQYVRLFSISDHVYTVSAMKTVLLSSNDLVRIPSEYILSRLRVALESNRSVFLLLSAGSWVKIYASLASMLPVMDMSRLTFGLVDERHVPKGHADSNVQQVFQSKLIQKLIHNGAAFIPTIQDNNADPTICAENIDSAYRHVLLLKPYVMLTLGLGTDGHTAGILPTSTKEIFSLRYSDKKLYVYYQSETGETQNPHRKRFTITPSCIQNADEVIVFAAGVEKKLVLDHLFQKSDAIYTFPAGILRTISDKVTLFTDNS